MTNWLTEWENNNANAYKSDVFLMKASEEDIEAEAETTARPAKKNQAVVSRLINHRHKAKLLRKFYRNFDGYYSQSLWHFYRPDPAKPTVIKPIHGKFNYNIWSGFQYNKLIKRITNKRVRIANDEDIHCAKSFVNRKTFAIRDFD